MSDKIVITGGGTGGHVFPALAIAAELKGRGFVPLYVGSDRGLEARLAPQQGIAFYVVQSAPIKNQGFLKILSTLWRLGWGTLWSVGFLLRHWPRAVIGVGGYVSVPVVIAASLLRRKIYLQEQNVSVGLANRWLGKLARKVFLGFPQAAQYFPRGRTQNTGNPIRKNFVTVTPYQGDAHSILIMGGSQGARAINTVAIQALPALAKRFPQLRVLHQTGKGDFERVKQAYGDAGFSATVVPFIEDMVSAYSDASLVICRSGALTVSELIAVGRPAILVPYPRRGQNDQTANAQFLEAAGVGREVQEGEDFEPRFTQTLDSVYSVQTLENMHKSYSALQKPEALVTIGDLIEGDIRPKTTSTNSTGGLDAT